MTPQLYITAYTEQFASPGRVKRAQLRPTSAHRRNNPQPRPDFLFPRSLEANYRLSNTHPRRSPTVDLGRPPFPPVRHLSFRGAAGKGPSLSPNTVDLGRIQHPPPANAAAAQPAPPSADRLQTLRPAEANAAAAQRRMDYQMNVHPPPAREHGGIQLQTTPRTSNPRAASHPLPCIRNCRCRSRSAQDHGSCYSCFHVVKPYQAGHYIIHPEFVSECLP